MHFINFSKSKGEVKIFIQEISSAWAKFISFTETCFMEVTLTLLLHYDLLKASFILIIYLFLISWSIHTTSGLNLLYVVILIFKKSQVWKLRMCEKERIQNKGKERENSYWKLKRSLEERHTQKLIQNILTVTDIFLNQKRVNVCEDTAKIAWCHVCSHKFTLFWLRKTSVTVEIFWISFRVFVRAFPPEISWIFNVFFLILCTVYK